MKMGKITAKLRDAVPVCLMVEGNEIKRYKNIDLPDSLKELEMKDFNFYTPADGKITFQIHFAPGVLPEEFPAPRAKLTRAEKATIKEAAKRAMEEANTEAITPEEKEYTSADEEHEESPAINQAKHIETIKTPEVISTENSATEAITDTETLAPKAEESGNMELFYNVTSTRRKELATAVGDFIGAKPKYMRAPTYAFEVGSYTIGRNGTLTGKENPELVIALAEQGFVAA